MPRLGLKQLRQDGASNGDVVTYNAGNGEWEAAAASGGGSAKQAGIPLDNLQGYVDIGNEDSYPGTGTAVVDLAGVLPDGVISGGVTYGQAGLRFTGTPGDQLSFAKPAALDNLFSGGGTVIVLFRSLASSVGGPELITTMVNETDGWRLRLRDDINQGYGLEFDQTFTGSDGTWRTFNQVSIANPDPQTNFTGGVRPIRDGSIVAAAVTYDSSNVANDPEFTINGVRWTTTRGLDETDTPTGTADDDTGNALLVGTNSNQGAGDVLDGDFFGFLLFDRILDDAEITQCCQVLGDRYGFSIGRATDAPDASGQNVVVKGGDQFNSDNQSRGGSLTLIAGNNALGNGAAGNVFMAGGNNRVGGGTGGNVDIQGGESNQDGGAVTMLGGETTDINDGGNVSIEGGAQNNQDNVTTNTPGSGGNLVLNGGDALSTGFRNSGGGSVGIRSGGYRVALGGSPRAPGDVFIRSGGPTASGTGGGTTGDITLYTARDNKSGDPNSDDFVGASCSTGSILLDTTGPGASASDAGNITLVCGSTASTSGNDPGEISCTAGSMNSGTQANVAGGDVTLTAGNSSGTGAGSRGGDVVLDPGSGGASARDGHVDCSGGAAVIFPEFTVATLPTASDHQGGMIMVTDETGGYVPAFSDGTDWRRVTDRAVVS